MRSFSLNFIVSEIPILDNKYLWFVIILHYLKTNKNSENPKNDNEKYRHTKSKSEIPALFYEY